MILEPDDLRSAVDRLVTAVASTIVDVAGAASFTSVERAYLVREFPVEVEVADPQWLPGCLFSTLLLGPILQALAPDDDEVEHPPEEPRDSRVRQLVDDGAAALAQLVGEQPDACMSITNDLYGDGATGDRSERDVRDVTISLFTSLDPSP